MRAVRGGRAAQEIHADAVDVLTEQWLNHLMEVSLVLTERKDTPTKEHARVRHGAGLECRVNIFFGADAPQDDGEVSLRSTGRPWRKFHSVLDNG